MLEQPLPEDVAFRPAAEGGDASIVPARRRRASRSGERVFALGNVPYVARTQAPGPPAAARAPQYDDDTPYADADAANLDIAADGDIPAGGDATTDGTDGNAGEGERKRRRRGRRGGRGRKRPAPDGTPEADNGGHDAVA
ncbi:MAG: hypothetical protein EXR63_02040 [Dehalococcoidia bacterium]|nr:hypothetical protein [Dehalococcoidia bacterium]